MCRRGSNDFGIASIKYPEALEAALCWGWIDGQSRRIAEFVKMLARREKLYP